MRETGGNTGTFIEYQSEIDSLGITYTGRIHSPPFMIQFTYGSVLKSANPGILSTQHSASISFCAFSWTHGCVARNMILVRMVSALVSAASCINAPTKLASFVPWNAASSLMVASSSSSSMRDSRISPWLRSASMCVCAFDQMAVGMLKSSSARVVDASQALGIHLKMGNCSVGRYVPGLNAAFVLSLWSVCASC
jgi:hypothetical protein